MRYLTSLLLITVAFATELPNIIFVLCDDLGYGDVQCLNPDKGKILTPGIDQLAEQGMVFTDAHSGSSVCTPTRYGLMTGRYSWRTRLQSGVVTGFANNLIVEDRLTVAGLLKRHGYYTGIIGKWHLNFNYLNPTTGKKLKGGKFSLVPVGSQIPDSPITRGFDYYHGFHHAGSMKTVIENSEVIAHEDEINMLPRITRKSVEFIQNHSKDNHPFFLYVPYGSPHTPILPTKAWQGKSGLNSYADFVMETDDGFRQILQALDDCGVSDNTLVIFSSDNGCSKTANFEELQAKGHYPSGDMRGSKADLWDGGHRVPFIARWPKVIPANTQSDQTICLTDFMATCAEILGENLDGAVAEDSVSFLPAFKQQPIVSTRAGVIHHSISGHFGYRLGKWKLLLARGSGGWSAPDEKAAKKVKAPYVQLYNLEEDVAETTNIADKHPEIVNQLLVQLKADVLNGRSTKGDPAKNDIANIQLWKSGAPAGKKL